MYAKALTPGTTVGMINLAYVPRATAIDRGSWSLSRVIDPATIGSAQALGPPAPSESEQSSHVDPSM
jgi:hypothetical protein